MDNDWAASQQERFTMDHENIEAVMGGALDQVQDRDSFLTFVDALRRDLDDAWVKERANPSHPYGRGWNDWENMSLEGFLEAAVAWARDRPLPEEPSWQDFAHFLHAGKIYE